MTERYGEGDHEKVGRRERELEGCGDNYDLGRFLTRKGFVRLSRETCPVQSLVIVVNTARSHSMASVPFDQCA